MKSPPPAAPAGYEELTTTMFHEELDATLIIHIVCSCEAPMYVKTGTDNAHCVHCDNPCDVLECTLCAKLEAFDGYDEQMMLDLEEGEDDADL